MTPRSRPLRGAIRAAVALLLAGAPSRAGAPDLLGAGPRSVALAQADTAHADPAAAAFAGPTAAATPGVSFRVGYGYASPGFQLRGADVALPAISGTLIGYQQGDPTSWGGYGLAALVYLPDRGLARVSFRPAHEPTFVRHDAAAAKATVDGVFALQFGRSLRVALGASIAAAAGGKGVDITLQQDARGAHADGALDLGLGYQLAPIVALSYAPGDDTDIALRFRGSRAIRAALDARTSVTFRDNPLSGVTTVNIAGDAAYDPPTLTLGLARRLDLGASWSGRLHGAFRYEFWADAPPTVASYSIDMRLTLRPYERTEVFSPPPMNAALSPRVGVELGPKQGPLSLRAGYGYTSTPQPEARGYLTPLNPSFHEFALGAGWSGRHFSGLQWGLDLAGSLHVAPEATLRKENLTLPWASYSLGGHLWHVAASARVGW